MTINTIYSIVFTLRVHRFFTLVSVLVLAFAVLGLGVHIPLLAGGWKSEGMPTWLGVSASALTILTHVPM